MTHGPRRRALIVGAAATIVDLVLVFRLHVHPQDGLANLELTQALLDSHPTTVWNVGLWPYQLTNWYLLFTAMFLPIEAAEQTLMVLSLIVPGWGIARFLMAYGWRVDAAVGVAAPFTVSFFFHAGFYEFVAGVGFSLLAAAYAKLGRERLAAIFLVVTWFCHVLPFAMAAGLITLELVADRQIATRAKIPRISALALPLVIFVAVAPKATLDGGAYAPLQRFVKIVIADAFMATFDATERIVVTTAVLGLFGWLSSLAIRHLPAHLRRSSHQPLLTATVIVLLVGTFAPPSLFNGTFLWHRFGLYAWIFAMGFVGPMIADRGSERSNSILAFAGVALMMLVTTSRVPAYRQVEQELADIASASRFLSSDDIVAGLHGGQLHPYLQAYPTAHAESIATRIAGADYLSNIITHTGVALSEYPANTSAAWGYPPDGYLSLATPPTVVITMGVVSDDHRGRLASEGYVPSGTTDGGLATVWRR